MKIKLLKACLIAICVCSLLSACGGGGGGSKSVLGNNQCGIIGLTLKSADPKIVHGAECNNQSSPVVLLSIAPNNDFADVCSGTLITSNAVLTAGHCVPRFPQGVSVTVGDQAVAASKILLHPGYRVDNNLGVVFNDAAVIILARGVSNPTLPLLVSKPPVVNDKVSIFGFGLDELGIQGKLRSGKMFLTGVTDFHISAKFDGSNSNTCGGDSGGPAVQQYRSADGKISTGIVGIVSSGRDPQCRAGDATFFTNINNQSILNFILESAPNTGLV